MARKNSRVRRANDKGRLSRQAREAVGSKAINGPRISVEDMVMPDGQCLFQSPRKPKARFSTKTKADKALGQAQRQRARTGSMHVEKRVYECPEGGCGGFHLTSRESFDEDIWKARRALHEERSGA